MEGIGALQPWASLVLSLALPRHFGVEVENYYFADAAPVAPRDGGLIVALQYSPKPWLVLDLGANAGYFQSQRSVSAFAGISMLPARFWR
jgi:hypothetical protein